MDTLILTACFVRDTAAPFIHGQHVMSNVNCCRAIKGTEQAENPWVYWHFDARLVELIQNRGHNWPRTQNSEPEEIMSSSTAERLDADELLHLAIRASQANNHEESISYLKRAVDLAPKNGKVHYMLGAEHAQIGLYDRAKEEMHRAVELDPTLYTAHFQLGLLLVTSGQPDQAAAAWQALDKLGQNDPLFCFKSGLLHLVKDEFSQAVEYLKKGLTLNTTNEALNRDMQRILGDIEKLTAPSSPADKKPATKQPDQHVMLSAYQQNRNDDAE